MIDVERLPDRTEDGRPRYRLTCAGLYVEGDVEVLRAWFTVRGLPTPVVVDHLEVLTGTAPGLVLRLMPTATLLDRLAAEA